MSLSVGDCPVAGPEVITRYFKPLAVVTAAELVVGLEGDAEDCSGGVAISFWEAVWQLETKRTSRAEDKVNDFIKDDDELSRGRGVPLLARMALGTNTFERTAETFAYHDL